MMRQVKRENQDGYGGGKRFKGMSSQWEKELRLLIPSKVAGPIIGKGGENVKKLRADHKASVTIPDSTAPERIVVISAEIDNMCEVAKDIVGKLEEHRANISQEETDLKVLVHKSQAGAIIGRAGFKIKELRESSNTNIKVFPEVCPMSTDRIVNIGGTPENMIKALKDVLTICQETTIKGAVSSYDTMNYNPSNVYDYGGFPPDRNWRPSNPPPQMGGQMGQMNQMGQMGHMGQMNQMGQINQMGMSQGYLGPANYGGQMARGGFGTGPASNAPIGMAPGFNANNGMGYAGAQASGVNEQPQTAQVTIPKDLAGVIIGKGGDRINQIKDQSGAHVVVEKLEPGAEDRIITITGNAQCIQMAQYLLQQCVRSSAVGRKYIQDQQVKQH